MPASDSSQPLIFVSYSSKDSAAAKKVADALKDAKLDVWIDTDQIREGDSPVLKVEEGLLRARYFVYLVSDASNKSEWVRDEITYAKESGAVILPVLIEDVEMRPFVSILRHFKAFDDFSGAIRSLVAYFSEESKTGFELERGVGSLLRDASQRHVRLVAQACMDEAAFAALVFDLGLKQGKIPPGSLYERITWLAQWLLSRGGLDSLADWLEDHDPDCVDYQLGELQENDTWVAPGA